MRANFIFNFQESLRELFWIPIYVDRDFVRSDLFVRPYFRPYICLERILLRNRREHFAINTKKL